MGLIKRLKRITLARIESFLSAAEDPEQIFPQLVREMEEQVRNATKAEAKAAAAVKTAQRELDGLKTKLARLQNGAELAIEKGDEQTARELVAAQMELEEGLQGKQALLANTEAGLQEAKDARKRMQGQLEELRAKKDEMLTRARTAKNSAKVERTVQGRASSSKSILDAVARMETKVDEREAELDVRKEMSGETQAASLDERLTQLEDAAEVDKRLAELRKKAGKATPKA